MTIGEPSSGPLRTGVAPLPVVETNAAYILLQYHITELTVKLEYSNSAPIFYSFGLVPNHNEYMLSLIHI